MRGLLVAAEIKKLIAVTDDAFPLLFKQGLELGEVLQDDGNADLAAAHGGQQLVKFVRQRDVGKLVHHKMDVDGQTPSVLVVGEEHEALKKLCVEHADQKIKTRIVV